MDENKAITLKHDFIFVLIFVDVTLMSGLINGFTYHAKQYLIKTFSFYLIHEKSKLTLLMDFSSTIS